MSDKTNSEESKSPEDHTGPLVVEGGSLGVAGRMAKEFIHSPLSPLLLLACLAMGILGLQMTPRQEDPQISVPMVDIFVNYSGASSEQVASLAIDPLERIMSEIPGVKHVYSASQRGQGMVTVEFDVGEDMQESLVKLYDKLASNLDKMPPGVSEPLVKPKAVDDVPVVTLTLWSHEYDDRELRLISLDLLQRLKEVPNTSQGFVVGGRPDQIRVEILPERLAGYGISPDQVARTIQSANAKQDVGTSEIGNLAFTIYSGAFLATADDVARLVVGTVNNVPVYVRDIARVERGPSETYQLVNYYTGPAAPKDAVRADGEAAVTLAIAKKIGSNGVVVANGVLDKVEELKGTLIPDKVHVSITRNYGETANDKVNELIVKLFIATGAVTILVWLALGWRAAVVVLIVIPVVILITVFSAWVLGYTIDRVSLFALIFAIGILVDDAIVVVENIYRRWLLKGDTDTETAVDAVREVGNPTILATFTVIAALLPMGFVSGMMGPYMAPIPALGSVAMIFSLFAAFIFAPWLAMRIRPSLHYLEKAQTREHHQAEKLGRLYKRLIIPLATNKAAGYTFLISIIVVFFACCALFYVKWVTVKMMPFDNKPEFNVVINMPEGTALPVTANVTHRLTEMLRNVPEVTALQTYIGTASPFNFNGMVRHYYLRNRPWEADIQVQLLHKNDRERPSHDIAQAVRDVLTPVASQMGANIQVVEMPPGPPVLQAVVAEVYGPDDATRRQVTRDLTGMFEHAENIVDVDNYLQAPYDMWRFEVDTRKAILRGVTVDTINRNLAMAMGGYKLGDVKQYAVLEPTYIVLQVPLEARAHLARLKNLPIPTSAGTTVPLAELGDFVALREDPILYHKDLRPVEYVTGDTAGRLGAPVYGMFQVQDQLQSYKAPDGVEVKGHWFGPPSDTSESAFEWAGEWTVTYETFRDMGLAFGVALILIYMLVVWEFGNFVVPAIVMAPIPLTLIGIIPGHWIMGAEFTATSMIGFIALAGIIVRNSILLVDFSKTAIQAGTPVMDALVAACKVRTRPILITAFALVAGSSVILFDPIFQGMAVSLMFGVLVSTALTLLVIPLGCVSGRKGLCPTQPPLARALAREHAHPHEPVHAAVSADAGPGVGERIAGVLSMAYYAVRAMLYFAWMGIKTLVAMIVGWWAARRAVPEPPPPTTPPASGGGPAAPTPPQPASPATAGTVATRAGAPATEPVKDASASAGESVPSPAKPRSAAASATEDSVARAVQAHADRPPPDTDGGRVAKKVVTRHQPTGHIGKTPAKSKAKPSPTVVQDDAASAQTATAVKKRSARTAGASKKVSKKKTAKRQSTSGAARPNTKKASPAGSSPVAEADASVAKAEAKPSARNGRKRRGIRLKQLDSE